MTLNLFSAYSPLSFSRGRLGRCCFVADVLDSTSKTNEPLTNIPPNKLMRPSFDVGVALARLGEGLEQSPVERGNIEEFWFVETFHRCGSMRT